MTKNITVLDDSGNVIGQTFPKRAKGLIKKGRARYKDEQTLILVACPPNDNISEEHNMNQNIDMNNPNEGVNVDVSVDVGIVVDPETGEVLNAPLEEETVPETVTVKLLRYANGMENWHGEVQILLAPQYENGRNVVPVYSTEVEYTLTIVDCYDKEKTIRLKPSTVYAEGVSRGLAFVRFTPCVADEENRWIPEQNKSYWVRFSAIGTDGKLYVSENEREIILKAPPMLNGRWITTGMEAPPSQGGCPPIPKMQTGSKGKNFDGADLIRRMEELEEQLDSFDGQIEDLEDQISDLEDQISDLTDENESLKEMLSERSEGVDDSKSERRVKRTEQQALLRLLELEQTIAAQQAESVAALVKPTTAEENLAYAKILSSITATFDQQIEKIRKQYGFLTEKSE